MSSPNLKKFTVMYLIPTAVIDGWAKTDPAIKSAAEEKMHGEWTAWSAEHAKMILSTEMGGKTKRVSAGGTANHRNDIVIFSVIEAESHEAAAKPFEKHPHLQIPQASIEIMEIKPMGGG